MHPKVVTERLDPSSIAITMDTHSHVMPSMSRTAANAIEAVFGESPAPDDGGGALSDDRAGRVPQVA